MHHLTLLKAWVFLHNVQKKRKRKLQNETNFLLGCKVPWSNASTLGVENQNSSPQSAGTDFTHTEKQGTSRFKGTLQFFYFFFTAPEPINHQINQKWWSLSRPKSSNNRWDGTFHPHRHGAVLLAEKTNSFCVCVCTPRRKHCGREWTQIRPLLAFKCGESHLGISSAKRLDDFLSPVTAVH